MIQFDSTSPSWWSSAELPDRESRIERVAQAVGQQVDAQDGHENERPRKDDKPRVTENVLERVGQHVAPGRCRRADPKADKAQAGLGEDGASDFESADDSHDR